MVEVYNSDIITTNNMHKDNMPDKSINPSELVKEINKYPAKPTETISLLAEHGYKPSDLRTWEGMLQKSIINGEKIGNKEDITDSLYYFSNGYDNFIDSEGDFIVNANKLDYYMKLIEKYEDKNPEAAWHEAGKYAIIGNVKKPLFEIYAESYYGIKMTEERKQYLIDKLRDREIRSRDDLLGLYNEIIEDRPDAWYAFERMNEKKGALENIFLKKPEYKTEEEAMKIVENLGYEPEIDSRIIKINKHLPKDVKKYLEEALPNYIIEDRAPMWKRILGLGAAVGAGILFSRCLNSVDKTPTPTTISPTTTPPATTSAPAKEDLSAYPNLTPDIIKVIQNYDDDAVLNEEEKQYAEDLNKDPSLFQYANKITPDNLLILKDYFKALGAISELRYTKDYFLSHPEDLKLVESAFENNPGFVRNLLKNKTCFRDNKLTDVEKNYIMNPTKENEELVLDDYLSQFSDEKLKKNMEKMGIGPVEEWLSIFGSERLDYEFLNGHIEPADFNGMKILAENYEIENSPYAFFTILGAENVTDGITDSEKEIINEILSTYNPSSSLYEISNPLGGDIIWNLAEKTDLEKDSGMAWALVLSHQPLMEIEDEDIKRFVLNETYEKFNFACDLNLNDMHLKERPFVEKLIWAFPGTMEYTTLFEAPEYKGEYSRDVTKMEPDYLTEIYLSVDDMKNMKKFLEEKNAGDLFDIFCLFCMDEEIGKREIFDYKEDVFKGSLTEGGWFSSLDDMLKEIKDKGYVTGDCTNASYLRMAALETIGTPAIKISQIYEKDGKEYGHADIAHAGGDNGWYFIGPAKKTFFYFPLLAEFDENKKVINSDRADVTEIIEKNKDFPVKITSGNLEKLIYETWMEKIKE
ncbi:MAG: hypothetical protein J7J92_03330 [Candidatus Aenigmarchaeota archaeon]|nr:hypothetical protein [Candidatus Aenigmarchaeota archaeon]